MNGVNFFKLKKSFSLKIPALHAKNIINKMLVTTDLYYKKIKKYYINQSKIFSNFLNMTCFFYLREIRVRVMVFNATFDNVSVISWRSVLLMQESTKRKPPT